MFPSPDRNSDLLTRVFVDYLFGGEYFVNKLYMFVNMTLKRIFWDQNKFD